MNRLASITILLTATSLLMACADMEERARIPRAGQSDMRVYERPDGSWVVSTTGININESANTTLQFIAAIEKTSGCPVIPQSVSKDWNYLEAAVDCSKPLQGQD